jgi:signal transduction histidine kinase
MHESTAGRRIFRLRAWGALSAAGLLACRLTTANAASAATATENGNGPWIFVTIAFLVAALASFVAGRGLVRARRESSAAPPSPPLGNATTPTAAADGDTPLQQMAHALTRDARPVLLLESPAAGAPRRLRAANEAGRALLGIESAACGQAWSELEAMAPAALRSALADPAVPGGWWLLHDDAHRACLLLGPDHEAADETASLVSTVSHDLRAPIRVVEGFTRIVKEDYGQQIDRVGNDHLDRVLAASARMNQMIDAVLAMTRLAVQPLVRQPVDLSQMAGFVLEELARTAPERAVLVQIEAGLRARGDPTLLRLVLENLLGNAWKYSARTAQARIEFFATQGQGRRSFSVRDNGAGFDMRAAERLFGLFQRLHSAKDFPGTGVGLASVRRIVQRHGGQIWAESEPGRGATFHFTLAE